MAATMLPCRSIMSASSQWNSSAFAVPASGSPRQQLDAALRCATLAPTEITLRPWVAQVSESHVELTVNDHPGLEAIDPDGRESLIGCGAALAYLKLALKRFGCLGRVVLFPDLNLPRLVARVHVGNRREQGPVEQSLFHAMEGSPPGAEGRPVTRAMRAALEDAVSGEHGWLDFIQSESSRQRVLSVTLAGEQRGSPINKGFRHPLGANVVGPGSRWPRILLTFRAGTTDSPDASVEPGRLVASPSTTLAVVKTKTDDKQGWLAAGQSMARAILQSQVLGLPWAFFNQVRRPEAREALRTGVGHKGFAQIVLRFGPAPVSQDLDRSNTGMMATAPAR
jgi:hypothetical protein